MWLDIEQNTDEWKNKRLGLITSSYFDTIMANEGKAFGEPAKKYAQKKALEIVTGHYDNSSDFKNAYMDRGNELESEARQLYELETFYEVQNGGFNLVGRFGDSPDGNVLKNGCIEIKSVIPNTHWGRLKKGGYDTSYKWQIQGHLWLGNKDWCDYISYCPEMPEEKRLYIFRIYKDGEMISRLMDRLVDFTKIVDNDVKILKTKQ